MFPRKVECSFKNFADDSLSKTLNDFRKNDKKIGEKKFLRNYFLSKNILPNEKKTYLRALPKSFLQEFQNLCSKTEENKTYTLLCKKIFFQTVIWLRRSRFSQTFQRIFAKFRNNLAASLNNLYIKKISKICTLTEIVPPIT